jgi:uncharacterized protein YsxB (DUF464 family)
MNQTNPDSLNLICGISFSGKAVNSVIALGHISRLGDFSDPVCTAFSTAMQMFLLALEELRKKKWFYLKQEKGIMLAFSKKKIF